MKMLHVGLLILGYSTLLTFHRFLMKKGFIKEGHKAVTFKYTGDKNGPEFNDNCTVRISMSRSVPTSLEAFFICIKFLPYSQIK